MMYTTGDRINLVIGWGLLSMSFIEDEPILSIVACGVFIGGLIKIIFDK